MTAKLTDRKSMVPDDARPNEMAMMIQPPKSSRMAEATMIWPMSRRMKFISRTTMATILIEEIESAVARKSDVTRRACGLGRIELRQHLAEHKAADERKSHAGGGNGDRRFADPAHQPQIGFHSGQEQQHENAELRHAVDHALLLGRIGKQRVLKLGPDQTKHRGPEQKPRKELAHNCRLAELLHEFAQTATGEEQDAEFGEKDRLRTAGHMLLGGKGGSDCAEEKDRRDNTPPRKRRRRVRPPGRLAAMRRMQPFTPALIDDWPAGARSERAATDFRNGRAQPEFRVRVTNSVNYSRVPVDAAMRFPTGSPRPPLRSASVHG